MLVLLRTVKYCMLNTLKSEILIQSMLLDVTNINNTVLGYRAVRISVKKKKKNHLKGDKFLS